MAATTTIAQLQQRAQQQPQAQQHIQPIDLLLPAALATTAHGCVDGHAGVHLNIDVRSERAAADVLAVPRAPTAATTDPIGVRGNDGAQPTIGKRTHARLSRDPFETALRQRIYRKPLFLFIKSTLAPF